MQISSPEDGEQEDSLYSSWHKRDNWTNDRDAPRYQHTHKHRNQKQQSWPKAAVFENKKTEQNVRRYLLEMSLLQIYVEGSINWGQAVILRPILSAWESQQEEPDTPRTR